MFPGSRLTSSLLFPYLGCMAPTPTKPRELDPELLRLGATIRALREARGMTQERLSRDSMLSRAFVANVEAGRKKPSMKAIARIAEALVVPQISLIRPDQLVRSDAA